MNKILASIIFSVAAATAGFSQGLVNFTTINSAYLVSTNDLNSGALGLISSSTGTVAPLYYFALLEQAYPGTGTPPQINTSTLGNWTYAATATNYTTAGGINGGSSLSVATMAPGVEYYVELVGWSATLGTTWSQVSAEWSSGTLGFGFLGWSGVGTITPTALPSPAAFVFAPTAIPAGFYMQTIPEPSTFALAGLGGLALLAFRRKPR